MKLRSSNAPFCLRNFNAMQWIWYHENSTLSKYYLGMSLELRRGQRGTFKLRDFTVTIKPREAESCALFEPQRSQNMVPRKFWLACCCATTFTKVSDSVVILVLI